MISSTQHIAKRNKRWISIVTCIDRSVFPTEPWEQMNTASKTLLSKTNHPTLSISQIPYCDTNNALVLPKDATVLTNCESLVIGSRDEPLLKQILHPDTTPNLKWIHCLAAGVDQLPYTLLRQRAKLNQSNFLVTHHSDISSTPLAEYCIAGYLHFSKHLTALQSNYNKKVYERPPENKPPVQISNHTTVGCIGFGSIGKKVASICKAGFNMKVIAMTRTQKPEMTTDLVDEQVLFNDENMKYLLNQSDLVVLSLPKTEKTNLIIDEKELKWMKPDVVLCNVGRGNAINETALAKMLNRKAKDNEIRGLCAVLDVYSMEPLPIDNVLWNVPSERILMSPHSADQTEEYWKDTSNVWLKNAIEYVNGGGGTEGINVLRDVAHVVDLDEGY